MSDKIRKSCGTCHYWQGKDEGGYRFCSWAPPDLPFWASIAEPDDHGNWTSAAQGLRCKTWTKVEGQ